MVATNTVFLAGVEKDSKFGRLPSTLFIAPFDNIFGLFAPLPLEFTQTSELTS